MRSRLMKMWGRNGGRLFALGVAVVLATAGIEVSAQKTSSERGKGFSIYLQNGAVGTRIPTLGSAFKPAPAVGIGTDFIVAPWFRIGAEYLWSNLAREQRMAKADANGKFYGMYKGNFHNVQLNLGFNVFKAFGVHSPCCMGLWLSTGAGAMFGMGSHFELVRTTTDAKREGTMVHAPLNIESRRTTVRPEQAYYIPVALHFEMPLNQMVDLGLKLQANTALKAMEYAPKNQFAALVTLRYNFGMNQ